MLDGLLVAKDSRVPLSPNLQLHELLIDHPSLEVHCFIILAGQHVLLQALSQLLYVLARVLQDASIVLDPIDDLVFPLEHDLSFDVIL